LLGSHPASTKQIHTQFTLQTSVWSLSDLSFQAIFQGCQMVCFQTKKRNLGKFLRALEWKKLVYPMVILRPFSIVYGHLVLFFHFGKLHHEKSGSRGLNSAPKRSMSLPSLQPLQKPFKRSKPLISSLALIASVPYRTNDRLFRLIMAPSKDFLSLVQDCNLGCSSWHWKLCF
jgi:hypothetical protein